MRAGVATQFKTLARPTAGSAGRLSQAPWRAAAASAIASYVLEEADMYVAVPAHRHRPRRRAAAGIRAANSALRQYHEERNREMGRASTD